MKRSSIRCAVLVAGTLALTSVAFADHANFVGTWVLDKSKSEGGGGFGGGGGGQQRPDITRVITAAGDTLNVADTITAPDGQSRQRNQTMKTDGKPAEMQMGGQGGTATAKASWSEDGKTLKVETDRTVNFGGQEGRIHTVSTWSLSPDGSTLTIESASETPRGQQRSKQVFQKK